MLPFAGIRSSCPRFLIWCMRSRAFTESYTIPCQPKWGKVSCRVLVFNKFGSIKAALGVFLLHAPSSCKLETMFKLSDSLEVASWDAALCWEPHMLISSDPALPETWLVYWLLKISVSALQGPNLKKCLSVLCALNSVRNGILSTV